MSHKLTLLYRSRLFLAFVVTAACFLFTYLYYDFFYVEYEALFDSFYSGKLTEGLPFRSIYFLGNIGLSHLYSVLYEYNPHIEWISWILYSYLFVSCTLGLYIIACILPESMSLVLRVGIIMSIYFLVFADHNIHFIFTRVSYMVTGLSLAGLIYFFRSGNIIERPWLFIFLNVWFVVGTLTRSESATAAFLQIVFFSLLYIQNIKKIITLFLFPGVFLFILLSAIAYDIKTSKDFYKQIEPEIEAQFTDRDNAVPISEMKTSRDSVVWSAARDIMWADTKVISPKYLRSLIMPEKFIYTDGRQWTRVYNSVRDIAARFWYLGLLCLLLGLAILIQYRFTSSLEYVLWLAFIISFWFLTALQTYTDKVNDRSFSPLMSLFIFCHLIFLLPYLVDNISKKGIMVPLLLAVILLFGVHMYHVRTEANLLQHDLNNYQKNHAAISKLAHNKILVVNSSSCDYLFSSNKPFHAFDFSVFKKIYITDGYNIPFLPYYRRYLERDCHCDMYDFPTFWDYLRTVHENVVVVSTSQRMGVLRKYLKVVHGYDLPIMECKEAKLLKVEKSDYRGTFANLQVYSLGR